MLHTDHDTRGQSTLTFPVIYQACLSCGKDLTAAEKRESPWRCFCTACLDRSRNLSEWDDIGVGD